MIVYRVKVLFAALVLLLVLVPQFACAESIIEEVSGLGWLIESSPQGAAVFVDGIERGKTPLLINALPAGTHVIKLTKDYYETWQKTLTYSGAGRLNIAVDLSALRGQLSIRLFDNGTARPIEGHNAVILVDQMPQSYSVEGNEIAFNLNEGQKTITVRMFGYEDARKTVIVEKQQPIKLDYSLIAAPLRLEQVMLNRTVFNPANQGLLGAVTVNFTVSAPGFARLLVFNRDENLIYSQSFSQPFSQWVQIATWDGHTGSGERVAEGVYRLRLEVSGARFEAGGTAAAFEQRWVNVDYNAEIIPLSFHRLRSGLTHAEYSQLLPSGSFQIAASIFAGDFGNDYPAFQRLPFAAGFRWSPVTSLETSAAIHITSFSDSDTPSQTAAGLAVKKELLRGGNILPSVSFGFSYGWVNGSSESELGLSAGASLNSAFSWRLPANLSLLFSPALLWTGEAGYPQEALPRIEIGGGVLFKMGFIVAGISTRIVLCFSDENQKPARIAADLLCFPPPSNLVFGIIGGLSLRNGSPSFSGGLTLGTVF